MAQVVNTRKNNNPKGFNPNVDNKEKVAQTGAFGKTMWYGSFVLVIPMISHVIMRNGFNKLQSEINELASGIDVQLKKRRDTLVKLLEATKGYMKHEKTVLTEVTKLRKMSINNSTRAEVNAKTEGALGRLMLTAEAYPKLKADKTVTNLMDSASYLEREIGAARRLYNTGVRRYNQRLFTWPSAVIAASMGLTTLPYFEASTTDKKDVEIKF